MKPLCSLRPLYNGTMLDPKNPSMTQHSEQTLLLAVGFLLTLILGSLTVLQGISEPVAIAFWISLYVFSYKAVTFSSD